MVLFFLRLAEHDIVMVGLTLLQSPSARTCNPVFPGAAIFF
jgi:hypothetical protein